MYALEQCIDVVHILQGYLPPFTLSITVILYSLNLCDYATIAQQGTSLLNFCNQPINPAELKPD